MNIFTIYDGSDYCAGLNFGVAGAFILSNIADSVKYFVDLKSLPDADLDDVDEQSKYALMDRRGQDFKQNKEWQTRESQ